METDTEPLECDARRRVFDFVREHPGEHLRGLARGLGMPLGTTLYHLDRLERAGLVVVRHDRRYRRIFPNSGIPLREKEWIMLLHHDAPRRILGALLAQPGLSQRELVASVGLSRSTVSAHLGEMRDRGFVLGRRGRHEDLYEVLEPETAQRLLHPADASPTPSDAPASA